jgi:hypothetical protein
VDPRFDAEPVMDHCFCVLPTPLVSACKIVPGHSTHVAPSSSFAETVTHKHTPTHTQTNKRN